MENKQDRLDECRIFRESFDDVDLVPAAGSGAGAAAHERTCQACAGWARMQRDMISMAGDLPQFDVPEALTQRIITAVEGQRMSVPAFPALRLFPLTLAGGLLLFAFVPFESVDGLVSWLLGFAGLMALRFLLAGASTSEQTA